MDSITASHAKKITIRVVPKQVKSDKKLLIKLLLIKPRGKDKRLLIELRRKDKRLSIKLWKSMPDMLKILINC